VIVIFLIKVAGCKVVLVTYLIQQPDQYITETFVTPSTDPKPSKTGPALGHHYCWALYVFIFSMISQSKLSKRNSSVCLSSRICCRPAVCLCKLLRFRPHLWFECFASNQWKHVGQCECRTAVEVLWVQRVCDVLGAGEW